MKIICIHHRLAGMNGHRFNEACGLVREAARGRFELVLLVHAEAGAEIASRLNARPVLVDTTYAAGWSFEQRTRGFIPQLHEHIDAELGPGDCVLITVATQLEANALAAWLGELPRDRKPWIVILMMNDRWNQGDATEYGRQAAEFRMLRDALHDLPPGDLHRLIFCASTPGLADELYEFLQVPVAVAPMTKLGEGMPAPDPAQPRPCIALLGGARREKGSHLVRDIIHACKGRVEADFLVHLMNETLTTAEFADMESIAGEPGVEVIRGPLPLEQYTRALQSSGIILFPYQVIPYIKRTSGIFYEAVASGKLVVVPRGTWMARQLEDDRAAGVMFDETGVESIVDAISRCVRDREQLEFLARERKAAWVREHGISSFIDFMEREIALRQASALQPS